MWLWLSPTVCCCATRAGRAKTRLPEYHASLLPRWRGAAYPRDHGGDSHTGICIMQMEAGLDAGPVLMREDTLIGAEETTNQLHDRPRNGRWLIVEALWRLKTGAEPHPKRASPTPIRSTKPRPRSIGSTCRRVNRKSPVAVPGAWCEVDGQR